ncbi:MAG: hypothetical protein QNL33_11010 [Akkermansiaceae bacterium]|jgi:hypothetical protein
MDFSPKANSYESGIFPLSSASGQDYMPFHQNGEFAGGGRGYLTFNYNS